MVKQYRAAFRRSMLGSSSAATLPNAPVRHPLISSMVGGRLRTSTMRHASTDGSPCRVVITCRSSRLGCSLNATSSTCAREELGW
jgi:hypothetical protein